MDLTEKFLPNEKFLKKYENLSVNRKTGYSIAITNLRVFISNKNEVWDIYSDKIDYLGRLFTPMFSWWWQLIFIPISLMTLDGSKLISAIFILLSIARQQIRIETLTIGVKSKNWNITKDNEKLNLVFAFNYGSHKEIHNAVHKIAFGHYFYLKLSAWLFTKKHIEDNFKNYMYLPEMPNPDLLIRTAGEKRLSNFLLYQLSYTELMFIDTLWPDFDENNFNNVVEEYKQRVRKYGNA